MRASAGDVTAALAARLRAAALALDLPMTDPGDDPAHEAATLLAALLADARTHDDPARTWLLLVAVRAAFPGPEEVRDAHRTIRLTGTDEALTRMLDDALPVLRASGHGDAVLDVVTGGVVVDVDFSARHDLNTGIQRVVRSTVPHWQGRPGVELVAWSDGGAYRRLDRDEQDRVLRWRGPLGEEPRARPRGERLVVPWRSTVVLPEVPQPARCAPLAAVAELSGNRVSLIGYDAIPVVSAEMMPPVEPNRFVRYLTIVKHAHRLSGISAAAAGEFAGFCSMLPAQGLTGPVVTECLLPVDVPDDPHGASSAAAGTSGADAGLPTVLVVGSHEPRKNHLAVLDASEHLWREGLRFRLRFVGGSSWASRPFDRAVARLQHAGRPVTIGRAVGDGELWSAYRTARFTVFPSLHEGYGLPVAESLAVGTPAVTTSYGSTAEIAQDGGALLVDPRDDDALREAMARLLTDDLLHAELVAQALARPPRTWTDYSEELWSQLLGEEPHTS